MTIRLGDILVERGVITGSQRDQILKAQIRNPRPFGELAERMFNVSPAEVEDAWAEQYASCAERVDPRTMRIDDRLLPLLDRRQAWQFGLLPVRSDGEELVVCTTRHHLVRALKFAGWTMTAPCYFVLAEPKALGEALTRYYPMDGMTPETGGYLDVDRGSRTTTR